MIKIFEEYSNIDASVTVIENSIGEILLLKRSEKSKQQGWCLPGGRKDDKDSSLIDTARRELIEETGLRVKKSKFKFIGTQLSIRGFYVNIYHVKLKNPKNIILSKEHVKSLWTSDLKNLDLAGNTEKYINTVKRIE